MSKLIFWKRLFFRDAHDPPPQVAESVDDLLSAPNEPACPDGGTTILIPNDETHSVPQDARTNIRIKLSVFQNDSVFQSEITCFPCVIGRSPESSMLLLDDKSVSRKHALIEHAEGGYFISDAGSSNGVHVNGQKLDKGEKRQIQCNDDIQIGRAKLRVAEIE